MLGSGRLPSPPMIGANVVASATEARSATSRPVARLRMIAVCMVSTSFGVCMRRGSKEAQTVVSRLPNGLLTGVSVTIAHPKKGVEMPYALSRPWLVVLGVALLVALIAIGTAFGVGPFGPTPDAPTAMPISCPPNC